jgi:hypothetical protein
LAEQRLPWKEERGEQMSDEQGAPETKGVTTDLPATVDLGPEIEGMAGRQLKRCDTTPVFREES